MKNLLLWAKGWNQKFKFVCVGGLNTLISTVTYLLILVAFGYRAWGSNPDIPYKIVFGATVAGQLLGLVNSYFWNKFFTFEKKEKDKTELLRFVGVYAVTYVVDYGMKYALHRWFDSLAEIWIVLIVLCFTMVISYVGQRFFVFQREKPEEQSEKKQ